MKDKKTTPKIEVKDNRLCFKIKLSVQTDKQHLSLNEAIELAKQKLEYLASSNDGSEVLLNSEPIFDY